MTMDLPKINYEDLPDEVKNIVKDVDFSFESMIDEDYALDFPIDANTYVNDKVRSAKRLVMHRKYVEKMNEVYKKYESGKITEEKAKSIMQKLTEEKNKLV